MKKSTEKEGNFSAENPFLFSFRDTRVPLNAQNKPYNAFRDGAQNAIFHQKRSYFSYLVGIFRRGTTYTLYRRARAFVYPAIFISRLFRIARIVFRIVETSAVLLLAATLLFVLLPPLLLLLLVLAILTFLENGRADRHFSPLFLGRRVVAFFRSEPSDGFLSGVASLAGEYTVLIVTDLPRAFFKKGEGRGILSARRRKDGVLVVREQYFFHLRRRFLKKAAHFTAVY